MGLGLDKFQGDEGSSETPSITSSLLSDFNRYGSVGGPESEKQLMYALGQLHNKRNKYESGDVDDAEALALYNSDPSRLRTFYPGLNTNTRSPVEQELVDVFPYLAGGTGAGLHYPERIFPGEKPKFQLDGTSKTGQKLVGKYVRDEKGNLKVVNFSPDVIDVINSVNYPEAPLPNKQSGDEITYDNPTMDGFDSVEERDRWREEKLRIDRIRHPQVRGPQDFDDRYRYNDNFAFRPPPQDEIDNWVALPTAFPTWERVKHIVPEELKIKNSLVKRDSTDKELQTSTSIPTSGRKSTYGYKLQGGKYGQVPTHRNVWNDETKKWMRVDLEPEEIEWFEKQNLPKAQNGLPVALSEAVISTLSDESYNKLSDNQKQVYDSFSGDQTQPYRVESSIPGRTILPVAEKDDLHWEDALRMVQDSGVRNIYNRPRELPEGWIDDDFFRAHRKKANIYIPSAELYTGNKNERLEHIAEAKDNIKRYESGEKDFAFTEEGYADGNFDEGMYEFYRDVRLPLLIAGQEQTPEERERMGFKPVYMRSLDELTNYRKNKEYINTLAAELAHVNRSKELGLPMDVLESYGTLGGRMMRAFKEGEWPDDSNYSTTGDVEYKTHFAPNSNEKKMFDEYNLSTRLSRGTPGMTVNKYGGALPKAQDGFEVGQRDATDLGAGLWEALKFGAGTVADYYTGLKELADDHPVTKEIFKTIDPVTNLSHALDVLSVPGSLVAEAVEGMVGEGDGEFNFMDAMPSMSGDFSFTNVKGDPTKTVASVAGVENPWATFGVNLVTDPTTYVGAGIAKNLIKKGTKELAEVGARELTEASVRSIDEVASNARNIKSLNESSKGAPSIVNKSNFDISKFDISAKDVINLGRDTEKRLLTEKFIKNNMKATGRSREEVINSIKGYSKEFDNSTITFKDLGKDGPGAQYGGNGQIVVNSSKFNENTSKKMILGDIEHEIDHLFSDFKGTYMSSGDDIVEHAAKELYENYPLLKVSDNMSGQAGGLSMKSYMELPFEQQVRFRKAIKWLEQNADLKMGDDITNEHIDKLSMGLQNWARELGEDFAGKGGKTDVLNLLTELDPHQFLKSGQFTISKNANVRTKAYKDILKNILNEAYAVIPAAGVGTVLANEKYGGSLNYFRYKH